MRRIVFPAILALLLIGGLFAGYSWWTEGRFLQSTDDAYVEADTAVIAPRISGYVDRVAVTDNQAVRAGDVLFTLDRRDFEAQLARAEAAERKARLQTGAAGATASFEASIAGAAEARLISAQAAARQARADLERISSVYQKGFATKAVYDAAVAAQTAREADVEQARALIAAQGSRRASAVLNRGGAGAETSAAGAEAAMARLNLDYTTVRAPVDGVVGNRTVRVGQFVRAGQQTMVIVPVAAAYVVANYKETQIAGMAPGQRARLKLDAFPDAELRGRVVSFAPASGSRFSVLPPENATGNFTKIVQRVPVKIEIDRPLPAGVRLAPGLSVNAIVDVRSSAARAAS